MVVCSNALNQFVILCRFFKVSSIKIVVLIRLDFHCSLAGFLEVSLPLPAAADEALLPVRCYR